MVCSSKLLQEINNIFFSLRSWILSHAQILIFLNIMDIYDPESLYSKSSPDPHSYINKHYIYILLIDHSKDNHNDVIIL